MGFRTMARTHVIISEQLLARIDAVAGERGRSRFLEQAAREKLDRDELKQALAGAAGVIDPEQHPEWGDHEAARRWVRRLREGRGG